MSKRSLADIRSLIVAGLRRHRADIEQAICARITASVPHPASHEPDYAVGLQDAITSIVDYSLAAIEKNSEWRESIPRAAAAQARRAAQVGVSLSTIQRRYFVGYRELREFVTKEIQRIGLLNNGEVVQDLHRTLEALLEHVAGAIEQEYNLEQEAISGSKRSEIVHRLLSAEPVEPAEVVELDYEIDGYWHLALIASGACIEDTVRNFQKRYGCDSLCVSLDNLVCAWLGMREPPLIVEGEHLPADMPLGVGEPGSGFDGWCLTHQQARQALIVALSRPEKVAWYAKTKLLATTLQNETLRRSLTQKYLVPLRTQSDKGTKLRHTLRAYIDSDCNATSAAHGLRIGRHTVEYRIHAAEQLFGCVLRTCLPELDVALQLEELEVATDIPPK
jgi:PucR C-terminal helix-turn-helix domain